MFGLDTIVLHWSPKLPYTYIRTKNRYNTYILAHRRCHDKPLHTCVDSSSLTHTHQPRFTVSHIGNFNEILFNMCQQRNYVLEVIELSVYNFNPNTLHIITRDKLANSTIIFSRKQQQHTTHCSFISLMYSREYVISIRIIHFCNGGWKNQHNVRFTDTKIIYKRKKKEKSLYILLESHAKSYE